MITCDSILRRLPAELNRKQALFLDGIRHAGEIAGLAYDRLVQVLTQIAIRDDDKDVEASPIYTAAFLDAWAIVDAIDRFRSLWRLMPNPSQESPSQVYTSFAELTQPIRDLRNVADHLAQRADYVVARKGAALGILSWFTFLRPDGLEGVSCTIVPATLLSGSAITVNPAGCKFIFPTDLINLAAGEHRANLSEAIREMALCISKIEKGLEEGIAKAGQEGKQAGTDLLLKIKISFNGQMASPT